MAQKRKTKCENCGKEITQVQIGFAQRVGKNGEGVCEPVWMPSKCKDCESKLKKHT